MIKTETGFDANQLGVLGSRTYKAAGGVPASPGEWDGLDDSLQDAWIGVGAKAITLLEHCEGLSFKEVAKKVFSWWAMLTGTDPEGFETLPKSEQIAWEAVGRHLAYCFETEDPAEMWHMDAFWEQWSKEKLG